MISTKTGEKQSQEIVLSGLDQKHRTKVFFLRDLVCILIPCSCLSDSRNTDSRKNFKASVQDRYGSGLGKRTKTDQMRARTIKTTPTEKRENNEMKWSSDSLKSSN